MDNRESDNNRYCTYDIKQEGAVNNNLCKQILTILFAEPRIAETNKIYINKHI